MDKEKEDKRHAEGGAKASEAERRRCETQYEKSRPARESRENQGPGAQR